MEKLREGSGRRWGELGSKQPRPRSSVPSAHWSCRATAVSTAVPGEAWRSRPATLERQASYQMTGP